MKKALTALAILTGFISSFAQAGEIRIGAGAAPLENLFKRVQSAFESSSNSKLKLTKVTPRGAFEGLDQGNFDAISVGLDYRDWLAASEVEGYSPKNAKEYKHRVVGKDNLIFLVHNSNSVTELTMEQLRGIFSGKISNWSMVGGKNLPMSLVIGSDLPGLNGLVKKKILEGQDFQGNVVQVKGAPDVKAKIGSLEGAIGFGPMGLDGSSVKRVGTPEIGRPITVVTRDMPSVDLLKLFDFIRGDGAKLIVK